MADRIFPLDRRKLMAGLGATALAPALPATVAAQGRPSLTLQAKPGLLALRPGSPNTPIWSLGEPTPDPAFRFKRGDRVEIAFGNQLPIPALLNWHGIDGAPAAEPLAARAPLAPGARRP